MLVRMLSLRHAAIFFFAVLAISLLFFSGNHDIHPSSYLPGAKTGPRAADTVDIARVCRDHHAILYRDVESTEAYWDRVGGMTREDLEQSRYICERDGNCPIVKLYHGELYVRFPIDREMSFQSRAHNMLLMLSRVDLSYHPNADFVIDTNDGARIFEPCFLEMDKHVSEAKSQSRNESINHFLMPDFTSYDWWESHLPAFTEARLSLAESSGSFAEKTPKIFWRGMTKLQQGTQRTDLINQLGPKTDIADVATININDPVHPKLNFKSLAEMCQYQYIVYTEGVTYSGRIKYTALCNSIQIGHKINFHEFWTHLLEPYYVEVTSWDDAIRKFKDLQASPSRAAAMARGPVDAIREHLSPTGISCYIKRMLEGYARSMRWEVLSPAEDVSGLNRDGEMVDYYTWMPLEHMLSWTVWSGFEKMRQKYNATNPIEW